MISCSIYKYLLENSMKTSLIVILIALSLYSCRNFAPTTKENPDCKHIISGKSIFNYIWLGRVPVMIINYHGSHEFLFGKLGEKTSEGYMFYPERIHNFGYAPKDRLYKFSEIECLFDSSRNKIYGSIPKDILEEWKMIWQIVPYLNKSKKITYLEIESNSEFSFCLDPGIYQVQNIEFIKSNKKGFLDISVYLPEMIFEVDSNKNNYIGDIYLDEKDKIVEAFEIPCKVGSRPSDAAAGYWLGLTGAIVNEAIKSGENPTHTIFVRDALHKDDKRTKSLLKIIKK